MKKFLTAFVFTFLFPVFLFSQTPTPTPADDDVVKISTNLIQVDVTVTDKKGNVVKDLKREDFEIYENGQRQDISNFSFISSQRLQQNQKPTPTDKTSVPITVGTLRSEQVRRTIALVVDDLSLSFESVYRVRRALKKFVDEQMQEGDLVAIIRTGENIGMLQQFTTDKRILYVAIEKIKWNGLFKDSVGTFAPVEKPLIDGTSDNAEGNVAETGESLITGNFLKESLEKAKLQSLRSIVGGMKSLPGRKSVILFSDSLEIFTRDESGAIEPSTAIGSFRSLIDAATRASVVFYTIEGRGLVTTNITAQDGVGASITGRNIENILSQRTNQLFSMQEGLSILAQETGGFASLNSNDLDKSVVKALDDQSYYLIGYQPDSDTFDVAQRRFNKLEIKVKRPDVKVRYRSGFFNTSEEKLLEKDTAVTKTPAQQLIESLISPFGKNDISVRLNALYGNNKDGAFVRPLIHVNAQDIKFTDEPNGDKKAVIEILSASFGDNGQIADQIAKTHIFTIKKEDFPDILRDGFVYYFTFPMKKAGAYQLRVAIRDTQGEKIGSASQFVLIPDIKKDILNLSGIVLENLTRQQWEAGTSNSATNLSLLTNPMNDTSSRRFKRGTVLRYAYEIYNAKSDSSKKPNLTAQIRIFQDGKTILEGKKIPVELFGQTELQRIKVSGAISLGGEMPIGDYVLQIIITDNNAKQKYQTTSQFVQFELVE